MAEPSRGMGRGLAALLTPSTTSGGAGDRDLRQLPVELITPNPCDVVFPSSTRTLREPQNVHRQWRAARDRAGFSWVTPHTFRKGVATAIGIDNITWEADYPHSDSYWPNSRKVVGEMFHDVPDAEVAKIVETNARELYRFPRS